VPPPVDRTEVAVATATGVPELTLRELNKATRSFSAAMLIGWEQNNTAVYYRATLPIGSGNGKAAAVAKRLGHPPASRSDIWSASDDEFLRQQVLVLSRLRHDNVVRLLGYTIDTTADVRVHLFEFADVGTLHALLHN
jgi:pto-interacting protein 1